MKWCFQICKVSVYCTIFSAPLDPTQPPFVLIRKWSLPFCSSLQRRQLGELGTGRPAARSSLLLDSFIYIHSRQYVYVATQPQFRRKVILISALSLKLNFAAHVYASLLDRMLFFSEICPSLCTYHFALSFLSTQTWQTWAGLCICNFLFLPLDLSTDFISSWLYQI